MLEIDDKDRKCALYVRVSTGLQADEGESLDEQIEKLKNFCAYKGWKNFIVYREEGFSGKDMERPEFQRMITDVHRGDVNTVVVKKIDRLSRSIIDFENIYKAFETKGVDLISLQENFDTSTAVGRAVIRIVLVFAQMEREQTSERTIDVMSYRAKQGLFNGGYPRLGYDIDYDNKCLVPNELEIPIAREIFDTYIKEGSLSKTAIKLNAKGYRMKSWIARTGRSFGGEKFHKTNLSRLLSDPIYIGKIRYKDKIYKGVHQAIIDEDIFHLVQSILNANNITKTGYRESCSDFLLKGLVYCGACKSAMTTSFAFSKGKKYFYYRCTTDNDNSKKACRIGSVSARQLESLVIDELKFLAKDPQIIEGVVESATKEQKERVKDLVLKKKGMQDGLAKIGKKANNFLDVLGQKGKKSARMNYILKKLEDLEKQSEQLKAEIDYVDFEINGLENKIINGDVIVQNFKVFKDVFDQLTSDEKYDLMHLLIKKIVYLENARIVNAGEKAGRIKMDLWELPPIDPLKKNSAKGFAESNVWLPGRDSNPRQGG